jgi:hypothetical protein
LSVLERLQAFDLVSHIQSPLNYPFLDFVYKPAHVRSNPAPAADQNRTTLFSVPFWATKPTHPAEIPTGCNGQVVHNECTGLR